MILCVPGPRALPPAAPSTEAPRGMQGRPVLFSPCPPRQPQRRDTTIDIETILCNFRYLEQAGWYWGDVTAAVAHAALKEAPEGAFLVRDSSHPMYMLTLSVKTARGPTSIRIQYKDSRFSLDSSSPARPTLSSFSNVPGLVQHYMGQEKETEEKKVVEEAPSKQSQQVIHESSMVLKLKWAAYKPQEFPSLQHLARLCINRHTDRLDQLPLPFPLIRYVVSYPFKV